MKKFEIILDNYKIHLSELVQNYEIKILARFYFILAYASKLAPIEIYFSLIKSSVIRKF